MMPIELVNFWKRCDLAHAPFAHPADLDLLQSANGKYVHKGPRNFDDFIANSCFWDLSDSRFHLSLLSIPYGGNLATADIVILLLNPNFTFGDYYAEYRVPLFVERIRKVIAQDFKGVDFPFVWLDPQFCWHGGFLWWEGKLRQVATKIAKERFKGRYLDALHDLSNRVAHVELVPYHSTSFGAHGLIADLPSAKAAKDFAKDILLRDVEIGKKDVIITRQAVSWGLGSSTKLIVYSSSLARGASLGTNTPGGRAILSRYGITSKDASSGTEQNSTAQRDDAP